MPRIAFYTRISTDEAHQKYSLDAQRDQLEASCRAQYGDEWQLFKVYRDQESGTHMRRPGLEEMRADARARAFDVLLVYRVDRLSRKLRELALMVDELTEWGVALKSTTEPFDSSNLAGMMMLQMLGVFAQFEHGTIVERTKVGLEKKARSGLRVGGSVPFGYQLNEKKALVPNEGEAVVVRRMFEMYANEKGGVSTICTRLNAIGYRKRKGGKWDRRMLLHMLRNATYTGRMEWKGIVHEKNHEPLVPEELFAKVASILLERGADLKGRQWHNKSDRVLTGMIHCACGSHMVGVSGRKAGQKFPYYACARRMAKDGCKQDYIRADELEGIVLSDVNELFRDDEFVERVWAEANRLLAEERPQVEVELAKVVADVARAREALNLYFQAFETGEMKPADCNARIEALNEQLVALEDHRRELEAAQANLALPALDKAAVAALLDDFEQVFETATNPQKKHLLHELVKEVRVDSKESVEVWYAFPQKANGPAQADPVRTQPHLARRIGQCANPPREFGWVREFPIFIVVTGPATRRRTRTPRVARVALGGPGTTSLRTGVAFDVPKLVRDPLSDSRKPRRRRPTRKEVLLARRWLEELDTGQTPSRAAIARREGISRARVAQVLGLTASRSERRSPEQSSPRLQLRIRHAAIG